MRSFLLLLSLAVLATALQCQISPSDKIDCGFVGIDADGCAKRGCCWSEVSPDPDNEPWCFHPAGTCAFNTTVSGNAPFSDDEVATMRKFFLANIDIQGMGGVVASPDKSTPGGSYYFHWARDGALTMATLMYVTEDMSSITNKLEDYVQWILRKQALTDPNGIDIRTEPKYNLPDGGPYTGGWCRPQNDGPALQALALMRFANALIAAGNRDYVTKYIWTGSQSAYNGGAVKFDLDYVADGWNSTTCDLWEEVRSANFFWNRAFFLDAMDTGASFASAMGDIESAKRYAMNAATLRSMLYNDHYNGHFVLEDANRQRDAAVIVALNDAKTGMFDPASTEVANTVAEYNQLFCTTFAVNQADNAAGVPGILYGRYEGDVYAGGNPWILTSAALARLFYRAGVQVAHANAVPSQAVVDAWARALQVNSKKYATFAASPAAFAQAMVDAGDAVLERIRYHVAGDGFHLAEQLDRNTGFATSATDLTWSYAEVLKAVTVRADAVAGLRALNNSPVVGFNQ